MKYIPPPPPPLLEYKKREEKGKARKQENKKKKIRTRLLNTPFQFPTPKTKLPLRRLTAPSPVPPKIL